MYNSILTNITSIKVINNLNFAQNNISTSLKRMASGVKLSQAKDGAAECSISKKYEQKLSGLDIASNNLSHGNNLINIADNALETMIQQSTKIKGLCLKTMNGTLSRDEKSAIQTEINQLANELERQRRTTKYNDTEVFETQELKEVEVKKPYEKRVAYIESTGTQYIDTGYVPNENTEIMANVAFLEQTASLQQYGCIIAKDYTYSRWHFGAYVNKLTAFKTTQGSTGDVQIEYDDEFHEYYLSNTTAGIDDNYKAASQTKNSNVSFTLFARNGYVTEGGTPSVGYYTKSRLQDFKIYEGLELVHSYIPVVDYDGKAALYDEVTKEMIYNQGSGEFIAGEEVEDIIETQMALVDKQPTVLQVGSDAGEDNTISVKLGFEFGNLDFDISNSFKTKLSIKKIDEIIAALSARRAKIGAAANRMDSIRQLHTTNKESLALSNSLLTDTDIAKESTDLARNQILQQISASLFSQAHQITGNLALRLLGV